MPTFEEFVETLADEKASSYSQQRAVTGLGRLGDERAIEPLVSALKNEDRYVRREAAKALGESGFPAAVEPLIEALGDSEEYVRRNAITALGALGDERAVEPLKQVLEDKSYFTRSEAEKSLRAIEERLEESAPAEDVEEQEPESEPEPSPVPSVEPEAVEEAVEAAPPVQEEAADEEPESPMPPITAEAVTSTGTLTDARREEVRRQTFEHHASKARQIAREIDERHERDKKQASSAKWRMIPVIVVAVILGLRFVSSHVPVFILPGLLAIGLFVVLRILKKRQNR
jgi:hypothetical protein